MDWEVMLASPARRESDGLRIQRKGWQAARCFTKGRKGMACPGADMGTIMTYCVRILDYLDL
jgi:hypothetical protein